MMYVKTTEVNNSKGLTILHRTMKNKTDYKFNFNPTEHSGFYARNKALRVELEKYLAHFPEVGRWADENKAIFLDRGVKWPDASNMTGEQIKAYAEKFRSAMTTKTIIYRKFWEAEYH